jgi:dTDP-4-amino-4,6-dideoxygalactose transaminase
MLEKYINIIFKKNNKFIYYTSNLNIHIWCYTFFLIFSKKNIFRSKLNNEFSKIIGNGYTISYASGRMGFFHILKSLNLTRQDEVILQAPNCAVMYNAVIRNGAVPVVVDVDLNCLGSDISNIQKRITKNTKVIVVQHTLGIPCNIKSIASFCAENSLILIEDCALTVSSSLDNIILGNFGDYAIFSFDNTNH